MIKPTRCGSTSAAFYVRDAPESIAPDAPDEFIIDTATDPAVPSATIVIDCGPKRREPRRLARWVLCAALFLLAGAALFWWFRTPQKVALQVYAVAPGQIRIEWNHRARAVTQAASGRLEIRDGEFSTSIPLDPEKIRSSTFTYSQRTPLVSVRLQLKPRRNDAFPTEDAVEFVGPPTPLISTQTLPRIEPSPPPRPEAVPKPAAVEKVVSSRGVESPPKPVANRILTPPRLPAPAAVPLALPAAPSVSPGAAIVVPDLLSGTPRAPSHVIPSPTPHIYSGPSSGRLIWTGVLGRRGVVEIEDARASIGALSGALPGVPVRVQISPAEFGRDGLVAYTLDRARQGHREPAANSTGWNALRFEFDAGRAGEVVVLESPNQSNAFKRIVLRNDARACSVILVDWSLER
jgi:hypothetical protein